MQRFLTSEQNFMKIPLINQAHAEKHEQDTPRKKSTGTSFHPPNLKRKSVIGTNNINYEEPKKKILKPTSMQELNNLIQIMN